MPNYKTPLGDDLTAPNVGKQNNWGHSIKSAPLKMLQP